MADDRKKKDDDEKDDEQEGDLTQEEIDRILAQTDHEEGETPGEEGAEHAGGEDEEDEDDEDKGKGKKMNRSLADVPSVESAMDEAVPQALDAVPVLRELVKALDARMAARDEYFASVLDQNQEIFKSFGDQVLDFAKSLGADVSTQADLMKSMNDELEAWGLRSTRPSDAAAGEAVLQKSGGLNAPAAMTLDEFSAMLEKSVEAGHITRNDADTAYTMADLHGTRAVLASSDGAVLNKAFAAVAA